MVVPGVVPCGHHALAASAVSPKFLEEFLEGFGIEPVANGAYEIAGTQPRCANSHHGIAGWRMPPFMNTSISQIIYAALFMARCLATISARGGFGLMSKRAKGSR